MTLRPARAVDHLERYNITRSNLNIYHNVVIGNKLQSRHPADCIPPFASGDASVSRGWAQLLLHPISWLIEQHPTLSVVVGEHLSAKPMFLHLPQVDLQSLIRVAPVKTASDVGQVLEREHNLPFDLSNHAIPLWRLVVVPIEDDPSSFYLLYTFHHVIGDGRSAMALTEQLIQQLNLQVRTRNRTTSCASAEDVKIPIRSLKPIPASIEYRTNCYPSFRTLLVEATRAILLPAFVKKSLETRYWAGEIDSSLQVPNETELAYLAFSPEETKQIVCATKTRRTTVQSVLATAAIFATKSVFMSDEGVEEDVGAQREKRDEAIVFATPVSLRTLLQEPIAPEDQGNYTSEIMHNNIRVSKESGFWDMARVYRAQVVDGTTTPAGVRDLLEHFGMLSLLSTKDGGWEKFMASKVTEDQHGRKASVKLSNLGSGWTTITDDSTAESELWVQDAVFSQSSGVTASALTMSVATANGVLTVATTWQKAAFRGRARGELFVSEFKRILMEAIEEGRDEYFFRDV
ncbi:hypothetical protein BGZ70_000060 [Mortierella alpina]|uniref:Alcohol acetyltransferase n=1 Tax=Mortierella alpina TaxID=64518 RepID=A0A9P6IYL7_MORAP|nr:hypothetical protein BGZ70_000060 [Mortierella alpina]